MLQSPDGAPINTRLLCSEAETAWYLQWDAPCHMQVASSDFRTALPVFSSERLLRDVLGMLLERDEGAVLTRIRQAPPAGQSQWDAAVSAALARALLQQGALEGCHFQMRRLAVIGELLEPHCETSLTICEFKLSFDVQLCC